MQMGFPVGQVAASSSHPSCISHCTAHDGPMDQHHPLAEKWRQEADRDEQRGLRDAAAMGRHFADELEAYEENYDNAILTLDEAASESGYSKDHLSLLILQGKLPNAGKKGAPRIARRDLPRKPRTAPPLQASTSGPQLVQAALAEQGIVPAES